MELFVLLFPLVVGKLLEKLLFFIIISGGGRKVVGEVIGIIRFIISAGGRKIVGKYIENTCVYNFRWWSEDGRKSDWNYLSYNFRWWL